MQVFHNDIEESINTLHFKLFIEIISQKNVSLHNYTKLNTGKFISFSRINRKINEIAKLIYQNGSLRELAPSN